MTAQSSDVLAAASFEDIGTLQRVLSLAAQNDGAAQAAAVLVQSNTPLAQRWAAAVVYAASGTDLKAFEMLATSAVATLRLIGGAALLDRGERRGFAPLVDLLTTDDVHLASHPLTAVWRVAAQALAIRTMQAELGPPMDADMELRTSCQAAWRLRIDQFTFLPANKEWS